MMTTAMAKIRGCDDSNDGSDDNGDDDGKMSTITAATATMSIPAATAMIWGCDDSSGGDNEGDDSDNSNKWQQ